MRHAATITLLIAATLTALACDDPVPPAPAVCGDAKFAQVEEECDDGNLAADDGCDPYCRVEFGYHCEPTAGADGPTLCLPVCGDGIAAGAEECDDGDSDECDTCLTDCTLNIPRCGDGIVCGDELCDDGDTDPCDGCVECRLHVNVCGDGHRCRNEACDDGNLNDCDGCVDCELHTNVCGDGHTCPGEACDDANSDPCDRCSNECTLYFGRCGDGVVCPDEQCDDGNDDPCDGCLASCLRHQSRCGDAIVCPGEQCDDGDVDETDGCFMNCTLDGCTDCPFPRFPVDFQNRRWRLAWSDEFNGPVPGREDCYDNGTTPPQCLTLYWHVEECPATAFAQLADLDKCTWGVYYLYNWMDWGKPYGEGINNFDPHKVAVTGGELILTGDAEPPVGGWPGGWTTSTEMETILGSYDCGNPPAVGHELSKQCPFISGGMWSKAIGAVSGFAHTYGRFEVRARLPVGDGSWPAHWLLPQDGPWPGDGEIDIMEATSPHPDEVAANFHDGVQFFDGDSTLISTHMSSGSMGFEIGMARQRDEYHYYIAEWEPDELRFYVDNVLIGTVREGTLRPNKDLATGEEVGDFPLEIPDEPFHWILNSTIAPFVDDNSNPHPLDFPTQTHHIDFVRTWVECTAADDPCPLVGTFDGANCRLGNLPDRGDLWLAKASSATAAGGSGMVAVYPVVAGPGPCPDGGADGGAGYCVLYTVPMGAEAFIYQGGLYALNACREATMSSACPFPCQGLGSYDPVAAGCLLMAAPPGSSAFIADGHMYFRPVHASTIARCPYGMDQGDRCDLGLLPAGRSVSVRDNTDLYANAVCHPTDSMPNCPEPCPVAGMYTAKGCYMFAPPVGSSPFIWDNNFYYAPMSAEPATRCPVGHWDGANCYIAAAPAGTIAQLVDGQFYVQPACGNVPHAPFHP